MKLPPVLILLCALNSINALSKPEEHPDRVFRKVFKNWHEDPFIRASTGKGRAENDVESNYIEQKLDHFDETNTATWQMFYTSISEYFQPGSPIFIMLGGEWIIDGTNMKLAHFNDIAKKHNGSFFYTQHRYYGKSQPTEDLSVDNLKYLNAPQALADLAHFIRTMKSTLPGAEESKVFILGISYTAAFATWFGRLYPELVTGCWASCGPVLARTNFLEYREVIGQSIKDVSGEQCYDRIKNSFEQIQALIKNNQIAEVKAMFKICDNFDGNNNLDVWNFFYIIAKVFSDIVMHAKFGDIENICSYYDGTEEDYISLANFILSQSVIDTCIDMSYQSNLESLSNTTDYTSIQRPWYYQKCNGYGWFESSDSKNQPFGSMFPIEYFITLCKDLFGEKYTRAFIDEKVERFNEMFGGLNPGVKNYFFTQGTLDPLKVLGINNSTIGAIIPWAAHCQDLGLVSQNSDIYMLAAKNRISVLVDKWVDMR